MLVHEIFSCGRPPFVEKTRLKPHSRRKLDVTCLVTPDVVGLGLPSDNNFQPITSFVSIAMLGNEIVVGVTFLGYGGKHVTCCL